MGLSMSVFDKYIVGWIYFWVMVWVLLFLYDLFRNRKNL